MLICLYLHTPVKNNLIMTVLQLLITIDEITHRFFFNKTCMFDFQFNFASNNHSWKRAMKRRAWYYSVFVVILWKRFFFSIYKILMFLYFVELCIKCTKDMITIIFVEQDFHQFLFNCNVFWGCFFVVLLIVLFFVIYTHCMINFSSLHHYQNLKIDIAILRRENIIYNLVN